MTYREPGDGLERQLETLREQVESREIQLGKLRPSVLPLAERVSLARMRRRVAATGDLLQQLAATTAYLQLLDELAERIPALLGRFGSYSAEAPPVKDLRAGHGVLDLEPCDTGRSKDSRLHVLMDATSRLDRRAAFFFFGDRERPRGYCATFEHEETPLVVVYPAQLQSSRGVRFPAISAAAAVPPALPKVCLFGRGSPKSNPLVALVIDGLRDLLRRRSSSPIEVPEIDDRLTIETDKSGKELLLQPKITRRLAMVARMVAPGLVLTVGRGIAELSWYGAVLDHEYCRTAADLLASIRCADPVTVEEFLPALR